MTDERLQDLYARALAREAAAADARTSSCVSPEALLALVRREGPEPKRLQTLDHVMACDTCRRDYELLRSIMKAGEEIGAAGTTPQRSWRLAPLALAASVILAVGIGLGYQRLAERPGVVRGGAEAIVLLAPPSTVATGQAVTFAWRPVPNAHGYALELLGDNNATVVSRNTMDTTVVLPPRSVEPGEYRWWVRAATPSGQLASPLRRLRVERE